MMSTKKTTRTRRTGAEMSAAATMARSVNVWDVMTGQVA